jgi:hypothetical protein
MTKPARFEIRCEACNGTGSGTGQRSGARPQDLELHFCSMGAGLIVAGQDGDLPIEMPDLDVVTVDKCLRGFDGSGGVGCLDASRGLEVAVVFPRCRRGSLAWLSL